MPADLRDQLDSSAASSVFSPHCASSPSPSPSTPALEALGVGKHYGDRQALRHVDLVLQPGRVHGLLGPNGAGKTRSCGSCSG
jgi:ABC-type uncharacterized transport system ATPase subunit